MLLAEEEEGVVDDLATAANGVTGADEGEGHDDDTEGVRLRVGRTTRPGERGGGP